MLFTFIFLFSINLYVTFIYVKTLHIFVVLFCLYFHVLAIYVSLDIRDGLQNFFMLLSKGCSVPAQNPV